MVLGILLIIFGIMIFIDPSFHSIAYDYTFDFSDHKVAFGGFLVLLGLGFLWTSLRERIRKRK